MDVSPETKREFLAMVDRLAEIARFRNHQHAEKEPLWARQRIIQAQHVLAVSTAREANGKASYSNEETRAAALTLRLAEDREFQENTSRLHELSCAEDELVVEHNTLVNKKALLMLELGLVTDPGKDTLLA